MSGHGLLVLRFAAPIEASAQAAVLAPLVDAGIVEADLELDAVPAEVLALPCRPTPRDAPRPAGVEQAWWLAVHDELPHADALPCPVEGRAEILAAFDGEDLGIAIKLGGRPLAGEEALVRAMHAFWLAPYEHGFRHCGVAFDPVHRSALLWVDRLVAAAPGRACVDHLGWLVARLAEIVPVEHARFAAADAATKYGALLGVDGPPFVLAGNPLAQRFRDEGEPAAFAWAEQQRRWDAYELAAMIAELVVEQDLGCVEAADAALRLCDRGLAIDPAHADLAGYRLQILVARGRIAAAVEHARAHPILLAHLVGLVGEEAPGEVELVCDALDPAVLAAIAAADGLVLPLVVEIGRHAPRRLPALLAGLPRDVDLVEALQTAAAELDGGAQAHVEAAARAWPPRPEAR